MFELEKPHLSAIRVDHQRLVYILLLFSLVFSVERVLLQELPDITEKVGD